MKKYQLVLVASVFALFGCATSPTQQKAAVEPDRKSNVELYLQGLNSIALASTSGTCTGQKNPSWKVLVTQASACARTGQWTVVEELAYELSRTDVDSPWGLYFYSLSAEARKDYPRALWMIEAAIKKATPKVALFRYQKGRLLWSVKPTEAALKEVEAAVKTDPTLVDGSVFLGEVRLRSWELQNAESHFEAALKHKSNHFEAVRGLAECKRLKGEFKESIPLWSQAQSLRPTDLAIRVHLATAYEAEKQHSQALAAYRSLRESLSSGLIKDKPDFDLNEKIKSLESSVAAAEAKERELAKAARVPAQKGDKK